MTSYLDRLGGSASPVGVTTGGSQSILLSYTVLISCQLAIRSNPPKEPRAPEGCVAAVPLALRTGPALRLGRMRRAAATWLPSVRTASKGVLASPRAIADQAAPGCSRSTRDSASQVADERFERRAAQPALRAKPPVKKSFQTYKRSKPRRSHPVDATRCWMDIW